MPRKENIETNNPPFIPELYLAYQKIAPSERLGLSALATEWMTEWDENASFFKQRKICLNCHLTWATVIIIDILISTGAELTITATTNLVAHQAIDKLLATASKKYNNLKYFPNGTIPQSYYNDYFDIMIDCDAGLFDLGITPKLGCTELTHTEKYNKKKLNYPVISVDQTITKIIETFFGTGDGLCKVLCKDFFKDSLSSKQEQNLFYDQYKTFLALSNHSTIDYFPKKLRKKFIALQKKRFIIFGYGKVGRGIAYNLKLHGIRPKNILIIDTKSDVCDQAKSEGHKALQLISENLELIKQKISTRHYAITATGVESCISNWFESENFQGIKKFNMGTPNEWGSKFNVQSIFNEAKPANFYEEHPTQVKFLDSIFVVLLITTKYVASSYKNLKPGFQKLPREKDISAIANWAFNYPEYKEQIYKLIPEESRVWFNHEIKRQQLKKDQLLRELVEKTALNSNESVSNPLLRITA